MFHATDLDPADDRSPLSGVHAIFVTDASTNRFLQPCPAAVNGRCTIHEHRPAMCRAYSCDLLTAVDDGSTNIDEARQTVEHAVTLRDRVRPALESLVTRPSSAGNLLPVQTTADEPPTPVPPPSVRRLASRSIPGMRNALARRIADTDHDQLPSHVRTVLADTDELLGLLRDRFGLGRERG
jgi:hypothetical protein